MRVLFPLLLLAALSSAPALAQMPRERDGARSPEAWEARREAMREFRQQMRREEGRMPSRDYDGERPRMPPPEGGRGLRRLSPEERVLLREQLRDGGRR